jgi:hypothetical protein
MAESWRNGENVKASNRKKIIGENGEIMKKIKLNENNRKMA